MAQKVTTGTEVAHGDGHKKPFPPLDPQFFASQLIWLAITFIALYMLLSRLALPRIGEVIEERRSRIRRDLDEAERLKTETDKALKAYEQSLADAKANAGSIARETRDRLAAETEREKAAVETQVAAKLADAEARIAGTKAKAMASVSEIASETAVAVVSQLIGVAPSAAEVKKALSSTPGE